MRQEMFTASRGEGAQVEGRKMRVSKQTTLEGSLIATGFPYRADSPWLDEYLAMLKAVMTQAAGLRRPGAAALDLAYVAAGRVDGFWEMGLKPWDTAAGTLLITEAGGRVGTLTGEDYKQGGHIVGGTPKVFAALVAATRAARHRRAHTLERANCAAACALTSGFSTRPALRSGLAQKP